MKKQSNKESMQTLSKKKKFMIYITVSKKILYASFMIYTIVGTVDPMYNFFHVRTFDVSKFSPILLSSTRIKPLFPITQRWII